MAKAETKFHPDNLKVGKLYKFQILTSGGTLEIEVGKFKSMESMPGPNGRQLMLWFDVDLGEDGWQPVPFEVSAIKAVKEMH